MFFLDQFDSHDDRDDDGEGESVEEHKSVIMHLLSQVRLGMDLTKVSTFSFFPHQCVLSYVTPVWSVLIMVPFSCFKAESFPSLTC